MTKTAGMIFFIMAALVLGLAIANYTGQFTAAAGVAEQYRDTGLNTTDLRFAMGESFVIQLVIVGILGILGWFLFGSETEQVMYLVITGLIVVGSVVVRLTPLLPLNMARLSPVSAFYGAQVEFQMSADDTMFYLTLPRDTNYRVARLGKDLPEKDGHVLLDFHKDQALASAYARSKVPVTVVGTVTGTRTLVREREIFLVPRVKVYQVSSK
ncbi:MAG TPA: hypothetical protein VGM19_10545 [Armatimonadota bacterium]|jgi:hypothetical protein